MSSPVSEVRRGRAFAIQRLGPSFEKPSQVPDYLLEDLSSTCVRLRRVGINAARDRTQRALQRVVLQVEGPLQPPGVSLVQLKVELDPAIVVGEPPDVLPVATGHLSAGRLQ